MIGKTILAAGLVLMTATTMAEDREPYMDYRSHDNCVRAAQRSTDNLQVEPRYFVYRNNASRTYYLNATATTVGSTEYANAAEPIRIACETRATGHKVVAIRISSGRYAARSESRATIAAQ